MGSSALEVQIARLCNRPISEIADLPLKRAVAGRVNRTLLVNMLVSVGGPRMAEYLTSDLTISDAVHWALVLREGGEPAESVSNRPRLRPVNESDLPHLYQSATDPEFGFRWRFRGATPSWDEFQHYLWSGTFAQFMVEGSLDRERYGLVAAYNAQADLGHAYVAMYRCSPRRGHGEVVIGAGLLMTHLFDSFPFRKLYAEVPGFNEAELQLSELAVFHQEGELIAHDFHAGRWWNRHLFSVWRDEWDAFAAETPGLKQLASS